MDAEQIDDILDACMQNDFETLYKCAEIEIDNEQNTSKFSSNKTKIYSTIMRKIEDGDYDYFKTKQDDPIYSKFYFTLMLYSTKTEDIKQCVYKNKELDLNADTLINLICATKQADFIIQCIENRKEYGLDVEEYFRLIKDTRDSEFQKKVVRNYYEYSLNSLKICELIKLIDEPEFTKECIDNRKKYGFLPFSLVDLIILADTSKNKNYIKDFIENSINDTCDIKFNFLYDIYNLIKGTHDIEYIKSCVLQKEKYKLDKDRTISLIIEIDEPEFIDVCINNSKSLGLNADELTSIIIQLEDISYSKKCIENSRFLQSIGFNSEHFHKIILATNEPEFIKQCIESIETNNLEIQPTIQLITATKDANFIKKCISNKNTYKLSSEEILLLICETKDSDFIIDCFKNRYEELSIETSNYKVLLLEATLVDGKNKGEFIKQCIDNKLYNLNPLTITILIGELNDTEYTKKCINNAEFLGLKREWIIDLILQTQDKELLENYLQEIEKNNSQIINSKIELNNNITFGIEIETVGENSTAIQKMSNIIAKGWKAKPEGSLVMGAEVTSPILTADYENKEHSIIKVCRRLEALRSNS